MIQFIFLILLLIYTGVMTLNFFEKDIKITHIICFSFPLGLAIHAFLLTIFVYLRLDYSYLIFVIISLLFTLSIFRNKPRIKNDLKGIPIYFIIILVLLGVRLIQFSITGFIDFYNFDEFSAYQKNAYVLGVFNDFSGFFGTYSPINTFLATKTYEALGFNINAVRGFTPIFFILTSLFIFISLRKNEINKHISALIAILFLFGSSELILLSKTFYTNIYFLYYFTVSIYLILSHYHIDNKKGLPYIGLLFFVGFLSTRKDALLVGVAFIISYMFINLLKKRINLKQFLFIFLFFSMLIISFRIANNYNVNLKTGTSENVNGFLVTSRLDTYKEKLQISNIKSFVKELYKQTFSFDLYYFNWVSFLIFGITTIITFITLFNKNLFKKYRQLLFWTKFAQFAYIALVMLTEIFIFSVYEFTLAASFSRYVLGVISIDYILLATLIFGDTVIISEGFKKKHKIGYYVILFLIFLMIPVFIEKFIFAKESFSIIRFLLLFIICELIGFKVTKKD